MPKKDLTEIVFILDRSGSMNAIKTDAIGGFNTFVDEQKKVPGEALMTLCIFNHEYQLLYTGKRLNEVEKLTEQSYIPMGTTALLDAIGRTIDDVGNRFSAMSDEQRPEKVVIGIMTDGLENSSSDYSREMIKSKITHQRDVYKWEFIFLGANQDAFAEAGKLGISPNLTFNYAATPDGTSRAYRKLSEGVASYRRADSTRNVKK